AVSAALFIMTLGVFSQVRTFQFVNYDDNLYVTENPYVRDGLTKKGVLWAFTTAYTGNRQPLTWLSHMLDITIYGLKPSGHHITNILIHGANTVLLFILLNLMTGLPWRSAFVAALFCVHPLHVETVAWVSERKGLLSAFFWLSAMLFYVSYIKKPSVVRYLPVLFCFIASLLSKPIAIMLPVVLLLVDYWPLGRRINKQIFIEKIPLFLLSAIMGVLTYQAQRDWNVEEFFNVLPFTQRLSNAFISYVMYLYNTVVPLWLSPIYVYHNMVNIVQAGVSASVVIGVSAASIVFIKRTPYFFAGWFWFLSVLLPVAGLAQVGYQSMADRYAYLPLIGLFIVIATAVCEWERGLAGREVILCIAAVAVLTASTYLSVRQTAYWRDDISLFKRAADVTDDNFIALFNLGSAYLSRGNENDALANYNKSISIKPTYEKPYVSAGFIMLHKNRPNEASLYFTKASDLDPGDPVPVYGTGLVLMRTGSPEEALVYFKKALSIDPNFGPAKEFIR
ncbi:MAG: tetratricopeptide repeat protein, partial [Nitrospirae bacterium]|nr:tetratricopeptide repeat protein [Nitrospirota bacterium]